METALRGNIVFNVGVTLISDLVEFSDEEGYGKYLDLHECYVKFINVKGIEVQKTCSTTTVITFDLCLT